MLIRTAARFLLVPSWSGLIFNAERSIFSENFKQCEVIVGCAAGCDIKCRPRCMRATPKLILMSTRWALSPDSIALSCSNFIDSMTLLSVNPFIAFFKASEYSSFGSCVKTESVFDCGAIRCSEKLLLYFHPFLALSLWGIGSGLSINWRLPLFFRKVARFFSMISFPGCKIRAETNSSSDSLYKRS